MTDSPRTAVSNPPVQPMEANLGPGDVIRRSATPASDLPPPTRQLTPVVASNKRENIVRRVIVGDPLEALGGVILAECRLGVIELVELAGQGANATVELALPPLEVLPIETAGFVPLLGLAPFLTLEQ